MIRDAITIAYDIIWYIDSILQKAIILNPLVYTLHIYALIYTYT